MALRVTQIGNEIWVTNPSNLRTTQIGKEAWVNNPSHIRVTQIGAETWVNNPSHIRVTQIGVELWRTTGNLTYIPPISVGVGNSGMAAMSLPVQRKVMSYTGFNPAGGNASQLNPGGKGPPG